MNTISLFRTTNPVIISLGSHTGIIQSILDYDYLIKCKRPSVVAIIASGRKQERYFWGESEVIIPVFSGIESVSTEMRKACTAVINVQSARRVLSSTKQAVDVLPNVKVVSIFAEQTPESHSLELAKISKERSVLFVGPSSVGLLIPGYMKLGAIGGTQHQQLSSANTLQAGDTAVLSTSGGIVNELIRTVTGTGLGVSFALAIGGDRYPVTTPAEAVSIAQQDTQTKRIVYFGELGGTDEYEIAKLIEDKIVTKEIIVHIAGSVADLFENPPQFGHAKAFAEQYDESAKAKQARLQEAGAVVCETFADIEKELLKRVKKPLPESKDIIGERTRSMIMSHISGDKDDSVQLLGRDLINTISENTISSLILSLLLGTQVSSKRAIEFTDYVFRVLMDHGPYVSGALNTIVSARAGKDLVSSLTAGLLTIGPRFGGAINEASNGWLNAVENGVSARDFVESYAKQGIAISGIGHKKYNTNLPDPRVEALMKFTRNKNGDRYLTFALSVEEITVSKKNNLILNVDGAIAAILLDILESEFKYTHQQLQELVDIEFFNALFVLSRSIGFTAHYLDQRRHDEGLLRLSPDDVRYIE